jgi:PAS domain S-box-containing protein
VLGQTSDVSRDVEMDATMIGLGLRFRDVVDTLSDAVFQLDTDHRLLYLGGGWTALTGLCISECIGCPIEQFAWADDRDLLVSAFEGIEHDVQTHFNNAVSDIQHPGRPSELRLRRHDGGFRWVEVRRRALRDAENQFVGVIGTLRDVTDRHLSDDRLRQSEGLFRAAFDASPLGIGVYCVDGFFLQTNRRLAELFDCSPGQIATSDIYTFIDPGDVAAVRASVDRALGGKRVVGMCVRCRGRGGQPLPLQLNITPMGDGLLGAGRVLLEFQAAREVERTPTPVTARALAPSMSHAMRTALNAILGYSEMILDAQPADGPTADYVRTIASNGRVLLDHVRSLTTDASGLPAETQPVPEPAPQPATQPVPQSELQSSAPVGTPTGTPTATPIGTPIGTTEQSAGQPLPVRAWQKATNATSTESAMVLRGSPLRGRVLLADDSKDSQKLVSYLLRRIGVEVEVVEDGLRAVESVVAAIEAGRPFDIVLMDMQMPQLDGCGATRALRERNLSVPVIALTAHALAGDRERCFAAGCDDYLSKPIDRHALTHLITRVLDRRAASENASTPSDPVVETTPSAPSLQTPRSMASPPTRSGMKSTPATHAWIATLPPQVASIKQALAIKDLVTLRAGVLKVAKQSAGVGLDRIGALATEAEVAIRLGADAATVRTSIETLLSAVRRMSGYDATAELAALELSRQEAA